MTNVVIPCLAAGLVYFVIALATGASAIASTIGAVVVAAVAVTIGMIVRAIFKRRSANR